MAQEPEDPVALVVKAAHDHIPVDVHGTRGSTSNGLISTEDRPSIDEIVQELEDADEYKDQVSYRRVFDAKEAQYGKPDVTWG